MLASILALVHQWGSSHRPKIYVHAKSTPVRGAGPIYCWLTDMQITGDNKIHGGRNKSDRVETRC